MISGKAQDSYVIGLSPNNLLFIEFRFDYSTGREPVSRVTYGIMHVSEATIIPGKQNALEILQEIKDSREKISIVAPTIFESCLNPDGINVDNLHVYEVRVGWEVR